MKVSHLVVVPLPGCDNGETPVIARLQMLQVSANGVISKDIADMDNQKEMEHFAGNLPKYFLALYNESNDVPGLENKFKGIPPTFAISDMFLAFVPPIVAGVMESLGKPMLPIIVCFPSSATAAFYHVATKEHQGFGDLFNHMVANEVASGMDKIAAWDKHVFTSYGNVITLPGLASKKDYEFRPLTGAAPFPGALLGPLVEPMFETVRGPLTAGFLLPSAKEIEPEAAEALEREIGKPLYMAGFQFPEASWMGESGSPGAMSNPDDQAAFAFLDKMEKVHGKHSVAYASFGSLFWPFARPELVKYLIESLADNDVPFIFAHASDLAQLPTDLVHTIHANPNACLVKFAPQWQVLEHPATGFFVSHCGFNSVAEAVLTSTPVVAMPFQADQGEHAAILTEKHRVGVQLKQVMTFKVVEGVNTETLYDGTKIIGTEAAIKEMKGAWAKMRGRDGDVFRQNMVDLRGIAAKSWRDGESRKTMESISKLH